MQAAEVLNRLEGDVNDTCAEIIIELEIIYLENFATTLAMVETTSQDLLAATSPVLDGYQNLLHTMAPGLSDAVVTAHSGKDGDQSRRKLKASSSSSSYDTLMHSSSSFATTPLTLVLCVIGAFFLGVNLSSDLSSRKPSRRRTRDEALV